MIDFSGLDGLTCDFIGDFSQAEGDTIRLADLDADSSLEGDQAFAFIGAAAFGGSAGELRFEQSGGNTYVTGDLNGDALADFMIALAGTHNLQTGDFWL